MELLIRTFFALLLFFPLTLRSAEKPRKTIQYNDKFRFFENKGQYPDEVLFKANIPGGVVFLGKRSVSYSFYDLEAVSHSHGSCASCQRRGGHFAGGQSVKAHGYRIEFAGAGEAKVTASGSGDERYNFFYGNDSSRWTTGVRAYSEVFYNNIYHGIDLRFYGSPEGLKYDFLVQPGADPDVIAMKYEGHESITATEKMVSISTSINQVIEEIPLAYQLEKKDTAKIACHYHRAGDVLRFRLDRYDPACTVVIDPLLVFSTFSGALADNWGNTATYDEEGNLYSGGIINGFDTLISPGAAQVDFAGIWDVCILKFDSTGRSLKYATYLGGRYSETPQSLVVNNQGELLVFGTTSSPDFPVSGSAYERRYKGGEPTEALRGIMYHNGSDMFVAKLSSDGSRLLASTLMGGTANDGINYTFNPLVKNYGDQYRGDIFVDAEDYVYVASNTGSADFPVNLAWQASYGGGTHDGVVFKMSPDLSQLVWSSYLGGSHTDAAYSIKVSSLGSVYVAGGTVSNNFPITPLAYLPEKPGGIDGFIVKINQQTMTIEQGSYIGTPEYDQVYFVDLDKQGFVYLLGQTQGDYPVKERRGYRLHVNENSGQFIHKLTSNLAFNDNCFSTVFGSGSGSPDISLTAFMVNECGDIFLSGWGGNINAPYYEGDSTRFIGGDTHGLPVTFDALKPDTDGSDFYLMTLHPDAQALLYATFFGGTTEDGEPGEHVDGGTSRFDKKGIVYQAVCAGCREGLDSDFPHTPDAWSTQNLSYNCNNAAFKFDMASLNANFETNSIFFDQPGLEEGCFPLDIIFLNKSIGGKNFFWEFGNGYTTNKKDSVRVRFSQPGIYYATLIASDPATCKKIDYVTKFIKVYEHGFAVSPSDSICRGDEIQLYATGGQDYIWSPGSSLNDPAISNPVATPGETTHYVVRATNEFDCRLIDTVSVFVIPAVEVGFEIEKAYDCSGLPLVSFINKSGGPAEYTWIFGDGMISHEASPVYQYMEEGDYQVTLSAGVSSCIRDTSAVVSIRELAAPNVFTPNGDPYNDTFRLGEENLQLEVYSRWGRQVYKSESYQNDWRGDGLPSGIYYIKITYPDQTTCNGWVHLLR